MTNLYSKHLEIKDKYCVKYLGLYDEFVLQLIYLKYALQAEFDGIELCICCRDELFNRLGPIPGLLPESQFVKNDYGCNRELRFNNLINPVEEWVNESRATLKHLSPPQKRIIGSRICLISNVGLSPVKKLTEDALNRLKSYVTSKGFTPFVDERSPIETDWVIGIEGYDLTQAALIGIPTTLIPTGGVSASFYQRIFPYCQILEKF